MDDPRLRLVEVAADVAKTGIHAYFGRRRVQGTEQQERVRVSEVPRREAGCPYCTIARNLAAVHLYLTRMRTYRAYIPVYVRLAAELIDDTVVLAYRMERHAQDTDLPAQLEELSMILALSMSDARLDTLVARTWELSNHALHYSELPG